MKHVFYAATICRYCVQVVDGGEIIDEYSAGNHGKESQTVIDPSSPNAVNLRQLKQFAKQTAREIAKEQGISCVEYDPDLEAQLNDQDADFFALDSACCGSVH